MIPGSSRHIWEEVHRMELLKMEKVNAGYGDLQILFDVDIHVQ